MVQYCVCFVMFCWDASSTISVFLLMPKHFSQPSCPHPPSLWIECLDMRAMVTTILTSSVPRNLDHHSRPSFSELCSSLNEHSGRSGPSLLDVPVQALQAVREPARAAQLGAPLSCAQDLYGDLQQYYL